MSDNLYRRGQTWWFRIQVDGKEHRRSLRTTSKLIAKKAAAKVREEIELTLATGETRVRWKDAVVEWSQSAQQRLKPGTYKRYLWSIRSLRPYLDDLYLDQINDALLARISKRKGVTNQTRKNDITAVSSVLAFCRSEGWVAVNVARAWDRSIIAVKVEPIILPDPDDVAALISYAPGNFANMIDFARKAGAREEECAGLLRPQFRLADKAVQLIHTKTGRPRSVELSDEAVGTLVGTPAHIASDVVFWHHDGQRYHNVSSQFGRVRRRAIKAGAVKRPFKFHDLRHLYAVEYLRAPGNNIYDLQHNLGHRSIKTTERYLDFLTPDEVRSVKFGSAQKPAQG